MSSYECKKESSSNNKQETELQSQNIIEKEIKKGKDMEKEAQSEKEKDEEDLLNMMDEQDDKEKLISKGIFKILDKESLDQESNKKKESYEKTGLNNKEKVNKEVEKKILFLNGQQIESIPLNMKRKKIKKKRSEKVKEQLSKKEIQKEKNIEQCPIPKEKIFINKKENNLKNFPKKTQIFKIKRGKNYRKSIMRKKIFKIKKIKVTKKRAKKKKKSELSSKIDFEEMELNNIIKGPKNKTNQNFVNINNSKVQELLNAIIYDYSFKFIPQAEDNDGDKLNLKDLEIIRNISSNSFRINRAINIYIYPTTNYSSNG